MESAPTMYIKKYKEDMNMVVETAKDQISINRLVGQKMELAESGGDVIVSDVKPDILKVINTSGTACVYKKEIMEGKVRLDGSINAYVIYQADDETRKC